MYRQFYGMKNLEKFIGIDSHFKDYTDLYRIIFDSTSPQTEALPSPWNTKLNSF